MSPRPKWIYDGSDIADPLGYGERAVEFLKRLKHPKAPLPDQGFELPFFWERIVRRIYGPVDKDGDRFVKTVFCLMPRGARKTTIAAGLGLLHTFGHERRQDGQALIGASAEDQAEIAYKEANGIVGKTPWLAAPSIAKITESEGEIEHVKSGSVLRTVSSDGGAQLGKTPHFVIADELIAWKNRELWKAIRTGLQKTTNTLLIVITQAGRGQQNLAYEMYDYAKKVDSGAIDDPAFLPVIFEPPKGADWREEKLWRLVNPGMDSGFPDIKSFRSTVKLCAENPSERDDFKQFNLNFWLDQSTSPFVDMDVYDECAGAVDLEAHEKYKDRCWLAVDLGINTDLSAVVACWPDGDEGYDLAVWFFCPKDNLQGRADKDKVPYPRWAEEGFIIPTPGNVTDQRGIERHIRGLCKRFNVQEIAFDPAYAQGAMGPLTEDGLPTATMRQGWITMAPAIKELERSIIARRLRHGGQPVLRWNFENVATETDKAGNKSFHKGKSRDRIDGAVASAMAVGRAHIGQQTTTPKSFWETADDPSELFSDTNYDDVEKLFRD